jgi:hypothetical protein
MHIDLIQLTRDALILGGCDAGLIEQLDPHSPIELHFAAHPCLRIAMVDDVMVRMDAQLNDYAIADFGRAAPHLFDICTTPAPWTVNQAPCLVNLDGLLFLTAVIGDAFLRDAASFLQAIEGFYDCLVITHDTLKS